MSEAGQFMSGGAAVTFVIVSLISGYANYRWGITKGFRYGRAEGLREAVALIDALAEYEAFDTTQFQEAQEAIAARIAEIESGG